MNKEQSGQAPKASVRRGMHGPEPERLKITGVKKWEDAVSIAMRKKKPPGGWPKK